MSNPYERVQGGRLTFKGGSVAATSKSIDKKNKKKKKKKHSESEQQDDNERNDGVSILEDKMKNNEDIYAIDAAKKLKYEELFPVETKKFGYKERSSSDFKTVEDALDDRVKKKADRYCK